MNVNANDGDVNHTDNPANGHSVRFLNTMHLSDLFQAYFDCRRRKRRTTQAIQFEQHYESNCIQLHREIMSGTYQPEHYQLIYVTDPVMREIFVPTFRDRVVHHLLANWLKPKLEKLYIYDNYAGREGRGTLFGIRRAEKFMRKVTQNYQKEGYVLKLDIESYFRSIPKETLWEKMQSVIPAKAGIQAGSVLAYTNNITVRNNISIKLTGLDTRLRGYDGIFSQS